MLGEKSVTVQVNPNLVGSCVSAGSTLTVRTDFQKFYFSSNSSVVRSITSGISLMGSVKMIRTLPYMSISEIKGLGADQVKRSCSSATLALMRSAAMSASVFSLTGSEITGSAIFSVSVIGATVSSIIMTAGSGSGSSMLVLNHVGGVQV